MFPESTQAGDPYQAALGRPDMDQCTYREHGKYTSRESAVLRILYHSHLAVTFPLPYIYLTFSGDNGKERFIVLIYGGWSIYKKLCPCVLHSALGDAGYGP